MGTVFSVSISTDSMASCCWICGKQAMHGCTLGENILLLRDDWDELKRMRNDLLRRVHTEGGPQMKRLDQVKGWLLKVEGMEEEVEKLIINGTQEIVVTRLSVCCSKNCKARYKLSKKVSQKLKEVADLRRKGQFDSVVGRVASPPAEARHSEPTIGMESMIGEVWEYIHDRVGVIGLYGMGGVGKTTLLTEINNKLSNTSHDFNVVIWVVVSKNVSLEKVQEEIGKKIGYGDKMWANKSQSEKAEDIFKVLTEKKFVLLLDDIWKRIDLKLVGVPFPNEENKCKIVFTTRSEDVCGRMGAQKEVKVNCLAPDDAWDLFKMKVREDTLGAHPEIPQLARLMAQKCAGLPLALITIGMAMASKRKPQEWTYALSELEKNIAMFPGMKDEVFAILKLSFDKLPSDRVRSCFLYCSLFPEDCYIPKKKIIGYWFGEGFLDEYDMLLGHNIIDTLVHACLLEEVDNDGVRMHDVIRDMALWIACDCGMPRGKYLVRACAGLTETPHFEELDSAERMSLASNHIRTLRKLPSCPNLLTLFLNDNRFKWFCSDFFLHMPALTVLDLSHNEGLIELPSDIRFLSSLQYLNLSGTNINRLPYVLKELVDLKYLDITKTMNSVRHFPDGLISRLLKLQVLKMFGWGTSDRVLQELEKLNDLKDVSLTIRNYSSALREYSISSIRVLRCITRLGLSYLQHARQVDLSFLLERTEHLDRLEITYCEDLQQLNFKGVRSHPCFGSLRSVFVVRCPAITDLTILSCAPNLEIVLIELPKLRSIHTEVLPFPCLKLIGVEGCPLLKELPTRLSNCQGMWTNHTGR